MDQSSVFSIRSRRGATRCWRWSAALAVSAAFLLASPSMAAGQAGGLAPPVDSGATAASGTGTVVTVTGPEGRTTATRSELEQQLESLRTMEVSSDEWSETRREVRLRAIEQLERRLAEGDFRPGDVVAIRVPGHGSATGKVAVGPDLTIELPGFPGERVDLSGLLYSEATAAVKEAVNEYIRADRVEVQPLIRIAVLGAVGRPGYYDVAPTVPLAEILMAAGGPGAQSDLDGVEVRRREANLLEGREADLTRLTLVDLDARQGDQIVVPTQGQGFSIQTVAGVIGAVGGVVWGISRIF